MPLERALGNRRRITAGRALGVAALGAGAFAGAVPAGALAQSASSTLSQFRAGYGGSSVSGLESPVNVSTRDANGNLVITDGVIQAGASGSVFASSTGASDTYSGAGGVTAGSASAIGNNLSVNVSGQYNTVIVNATQTNTGAVSASTVLNGKVNLDGGQ